MLQSRHFPGAFGGSNAGDVMCMVPLLDLLNHRGDADVTIRVRADMLEFICDAPVQSGQQIWNNYGSKGNDELLMCYGFANSDNRFDTVEFGLTAADGNNATSQVRLTVEGVPQELIDSIEEEQNTPQFIALLKGVMMCKRQVKDCLD